MLVPGAVWLELVPWLQPWLAWLVLLSSVVWLELVLWLAWLADQLEHAEPLANCVVGCHCMDAWQRLRTPQVNTTEGTSLKILEPRWIWTFTYIHNIYIYMYIYP